MTLVVARTEGGRVSVASDTMLFEHGQPLPIQKGALKSFCLPGGICVSYSGSPELAAKAFAKFRFEYPRGASEVRTLEFFESSSASNNNDYIIAFARSGKLATIKDGQRKVGNSSTHWVGDKEAYEAFLEYEHRCRCRPEQGRAVNAALFADEMTKSPASDLYSTMKAVVNDPALPTVGGFVAVLSNRDIGFRYSAYSDVLLDWPEHLDGGQVLKLTDVVAFQATGENTRFSISQISPGYYDLNAVAFYVLSGKLLIVFHETEVCATTCTFYRNIEPGRIAAVLDEHFGFEFNAMCLVMSPASVSAVQASQADQDQGVRLGLYCEVNTMQKSPSQPSPQ